MSTFKFRDFSVRQTKAALKVGTDAMVFGASIDVANKNRGLDIGTGTGVLSMMLCQNNREITITGIDVSEEAMLDATYNFRNSPFSDRLSAKQQDFNGFESPNQYDLIFTNPPFYADALKGERKDLNLAKHVNSLTPKVLFRNACELLSASGSFWLIWPHDNFDEILKESKAVSLHLCHQITIFGKPNSPKRIIVEFKKEQVEPSYDTLTIRDANGFYTQKYIQLTKDFHDRPL